ncbi:Oxygen sensor histidine kinase NreB [compost metagenome]
MLLTFVPLLFISPLLRGLYAWQAERFRAPSLRWGTYYGLVLTTAAACGALWHWQLQAVFGSVQAGPPPGLEMAWLMSMMGTSFYFAEQQAAHFYQATRKAEQTRKTVQKLRASREALVKAQLRQRHAVAITLEAQLEPSLQRLHDALVALQDHLRLGGEMPEQEVERLLTDLKDLRDRDLRHLSRVLHPSIIDVGLTLAVRSLIEQVRGELRVTLSVDERFREADDPVLNRLARPLRLCAYRIIELALDNVLRHAHAQEARIGLSLSAEGELAISVSDDGCGLGEGEVEPGLGLAALGARVELLGGRWSLVPGSDGGTDLRVVLPLGNPLARSEA